MTPLTCDSPQDPVARCIGAVEALDGRRRADEAKERGDDLVAAEEAKIHGRYDLACGGM